MVTPGNVRELINIVERMVVMSDGQVIRPDDLPEAMRGDLGLEAPPEGVGLKTAVELFEARMIRKALQSHNTLEQAAKSLGNPPDHPVAQTQARGSRRLIAILQKRLHLLQ